MSVGTKVSEIKETDYHRGVETYDLRNCPKILLRVSSAAQLEIQSLSNVLEFDMMILGRTPTFRGRMVYSPKFGSRKGAEVECLCSFH